MLQSPPTVLSEPRPNSSNIHTKQGMEQTSSASDVSDPESNSTSLPIRLTWGWPLVKLLTPHVDRISVPPNWWSKSRSFRPDLKSLQRLYQTHPSLPLPKPLISPVYPTKVPLNCWPRPFRTPSTGENMILKLMQKYSFNWRHLIDLLPGIVDRPTSFISSIVAWLTALQKMNWMSAFLEFSMCT